MPPLTNSLRAARELSRSQAKVVNLAINNFLNFSAKVLVIMLCSSFIILSIFFTSCFVELSDLVNKLLTCLRIVLASVDSALGITPLVTFPFSVSCVVA